MFVCVLALIWGNYICTLCSVLRLSYFFYFYSALRMEASSYSVLSVLTYETTGCHKAQTENMIIDCSQNPQYYTIL